MCRHFQWAADPWHVALPRPPRGPFSYPELAPGVNVANGYTVMSPLVRASMVVFRVDVKQIFIKILSTNLDPSLKRPRTRKLLKSAKGPHLTLSSASLKGHQAKDHP